MICLGHASASHHWQDLTAPSYTPCVNHKTGFPLPGSPAGLHEVGVLWACAVNLILHKNAHKQMLLCYGIYLQEAVVGGSSKRGCHKTDSMSKLLGQEWGTGMLTLSLPSQMASSAMLNPHPKWQASASCLIPVSLFFPLKHYTVMTFV